MFRGTIDLIESIRRRDPAVKSRLEVLFTYPGVHALMFYRVANWYWRHNLYFLGRLTSQVGRFMSGVEIHPGATIGKRLFIDHGMGVVIGETAEVGDDVTLYHGVTLGGVAPSVDSDKQRSQKRHPTLKNGVIVGSGAQVLGPITVGEGARVGANAVVVAEVPPGVTVTGIPARVVMPRDREKQKAFVAYGTPTDGAPDPVIQAIDALRAQVSTMGERIAELETELGHRKDGDTPDIRPVRSAKQA